jgi:hypothetical protein
MQQEKMTLEISAKIANVNGLIKESLGDFSQTVRKHLI